MFAVVAQADEGVVSVAQVGKEVDFAQVVNWLFLLHRLFK